jgi:hypothetical protein
MPEEWGGVRSAEQKEDNSCVQVLHPKEAQVRSLGRMGTGPCRSEAPEEVCRWYVLTIYPSFVD